MAGKRVLTFVSTLLCVGVALASLGGSKTNAQYKKNVLLKKWMNRWDHTAKKPSTAPPSFADTYVTQGILHIPYAEIEEPFYAWVDLPTGRSRIDYYGGMMKTYQLSKVGDFGSALKVVPMTTETVHNQMNCFQVNGTEDEPVGPQSVLPDISDFQLLGLEILDGETCEKWQNVNTVGEKVNKYTLWIKRVMGKGSRQITVPVRYEMKGYNSLLGSHYDHYYITYGTFSDEKPSADIFEVGSDVESCHSFPGPGSTSSHSLFNFNPMKEFMSDVDHHFDTAFSRYQSQHRKEYSNEKEREHRKNIYRQNVRFIQSHNRSPKARQFTMAVNHLADRTDDERKVLRGKLRSSGYNGGLPFNYTQKQVKAAPTSMDWRLYGAVTPVKDQSVCGSCWSFGTTGSIEGAFFVKTGKLVSLSQQALVDCSWGFGNNGCDGGEDYRVYQWMMAHGGIPTDEEYGPYLGADGYCHVDSTSVTAPIKGYVNVTSGDLDALKVAMFEHGPISISIDASQRSFSFYANGVYYDPNCRNDLDGLDHSVLAVGYGELNGKAYWLVKNSWSTYYGNDGYVLMAQKDNNCGVATSPTFVLM